MAPLGCFPVQRATPIFVPEILFTDTAGRPCGFLEMNPSLHVDADGRFTLLVRCVDYRRFRDGSFVLHGLRSNSVYYVARGSLPAEGGALDLSSSPFERLEVCYGLPTYPTYWTGPEDVRFLPRSRDGQRRLLAIVPECNPSGGQPCIFEASLEGARMEAFRMLTPHECEKNWMPFEDPATGETWVVYSVCPDMVLRPLDRPEERRVVGLDERQRRALEGFRGSTNGVPLGGARRLFLVHRHGPQGTEHRWLLLELEPGAAARLSEAFRFMPNTFVEFPCSLSLHDGRRLFIACGVNDRSAFVLELHVDQVLRALQLSAYDHEGAAAAVGSPDSTGAL